MHQILQIGNGKIGNLMEKIFSDQEILKISIRCFNDINSNINNLLSSKVILLCNRMKNDENFQLLKKIIEVLNDNKYSGKIINFGSTTEFYPIPFKLKYGNIKKKSLDSLANNKEKTYKLVHIICPGKNIININKLKYHILKGIESNNDYYASISYGINLKNNDYNKSIIDNNSFLKTLTFSINNNLLNNYINSTFINDLGIYFNQPSLNDLKVAKNMYKTYGITIINIPLLKDYNLNNIKEFQISNFGVLASNQLFDIIKYIIEKDSIYPISKANGRGSWFIKSSNKSPMGHKHYDMKYIKNLYNRIIYYHEFTENCDYSISHWYNNNKLIIKPKKYDLMIIKQGILHQPNKMTSGTRIIQLMDITSDYTKLNFKKWIHDKFVHVLKNNIPKYNILF